MLRNGVNELSCGLSLSTAYLLLGEQNLGIKADFKIVSAETAHILNDDCADFPGFDFRKHCLKSGTVEVTPCVTIIGKMLDVRHTTFAGKIFEQSLLEVLFGILLIRLQSVVLKRLIDRLRSGIVGGIHRFFKKHTGDGRENHHQKNHNQNDPLDNRLGEHGNSKSG